MSNAPPLWLLGMDLRFLFLLVQAHVIVILLVEGSHELIHNDGVGDRTGDVEHGTGHVDDGVMPTPERPTEAAMVAVPGMPAMPREPMATTKMVMMIMVTSMGVPVTLQT